MKLVSRIVHKYKLYIDGDGECDTIIWVSLFIGWKGVVVGSRDKGKGWCPFIYSDDIILNWECLSRGDPSKLDSSSKKVTELEVYLTEALEGWKKAQDYLQELRLENICLSKEYTK